MADNKAPSWLDNMRRPMPVTPPTSSEWSFDTARNVGNIPFFRIYKGRSPWK